MEDFILSENIDIIVYGSQKEQFLQRIQLNSEIIQQSITQQDISEDQKQYQKNINKLLNFNYKEGNQKKKETSFDNQQQTITLSTKDYWITINLHFMSDLLIDPFLSNFVAANIKNKKDLFNQIISMLVLCFDLGNEQDVLRSLKLVEKLSVAKPPSQIKYQSQMLLLQSGHYQSFNDNIILASCEQPEVEPVGPTFFASFGHKTEQLNLVLQHMKTKDDCAVYQDMEQECAIINFYQWALQTNHFLKYNQQIEPNEINKILQSVHFHSNSNATCLTF